MLLKWSWEQAPLYELYWGYKLVLVNENKNTRKPKVSVTLDNAADYWGE